VAAGRLSFAVAGWGDGGSVGGVTVGGSGGGGQLDDNDRGSVLACGVAKMGGKGGAGCWSSLACGVEASGWGGGQLKAALGPWRHCGSQTTGLMLLFAGEISPG
jgi:hypothetical protein